MDCVNDSVNTWLIEFNKGNYKKCESLIKEELKAETVVQNRTLLDFYLHNNIIVCKCLAMITENKKPNFEEIKSEFKEQLYKVNFLPELSLDINLVLVFNFLYIFWIENNVVVDGNLMDFEEQLSVTLLNLCRVLHGDPKSRLEQIQVAFKLSLKSLELLDRKQALLLIASRILIALAAQDEFALKITLQSQTSISLPTELLRPDVDRTSDLPLLLLPLLHGRANSLQDLNINQARASINLVFAALLARLHKFNPAINHLSENQNNVKLRALSIYLKAWVQTQNNLRLEAQKLLEMMIAMKEGREGELGCRARILQAKLIALGGKQQQAANILRQATKSYGSQWILLQALSNLYLQMNQVDASLQTLELLLQCVLIIERGMLTFEELVLHCLHRDRQPSVSETLYKIANKLYELQRYEAASERMLQLLARQEDVTLCSPHVAPLRVLVRETAMMLLIAGKPHEASIVCARAATASLPSSQQDKKSNFLETLTQDVRALLLLALIYVELGKWDEAQNALDRGIHELSTNKARPAEEELHSRLLAGCLSLSGKIYQTVDDVPNAKHAFHKALQAHKGDRELMLVYIHFLLAVEDKQEALKVWFAEESKRTFLDTLNINADKVLTYLIAPRLQESERVEIEKDIKTLVFTSRK